MEPAERPDASSTNQRWGQSAASRQNAMNSKFRSLSAISPAETELLSLLPRLEPARLLVDNYFDRIHWFMLVFHQNSFKE